ncbi:RNA polymerase sigma-70 factor, ECF subfamily [Dyadobacter soli]|uniref:RNA polymerase sigma-70 factor, ECF subfamily n=1 Tax=Dyadobacter soli TaxID=659014 RepID=A0A1G7T0X7_9BACT|nr:RNA polymerase sigma-70 factor [Dyadobacter soli]SDG28955.1 RNA polymerase sigma-70 factor, ECF subfamily [Dyadobacter soli]
MFDTCTCRFTIDEQTFEQVYNQHWEKLYLAALYRLQDTDLAKELVQGIFVSLWERRHTLVITGEVAHYLSRALKLKILEHYRTEQLHERHLDELARQTDDRENTTENHVLLNELRSRVQQLAQALPDQCRRVFELSRVQGLNTREIAVEMVLSEKTVKNHLTRALASFKAML